MEILHSTVPLEFDAATLIVKLWRHDLLQTTSCASCGHLHEEQYVVVAVFFHHQFRGSLCLRCLSRAPGSLDARDLHDDGLNIALRALSCWPVTLSELQSAERTAVSERFSLLRPDDLKRIVDDRFQTYRDSALDEAGEYRNDLC